MKVKYLFLDKICKLLTYHHAFLPLTIAKLSTFKNGPVFLAHPVQLHSMRSVIGIILSSVRLYACLYVMLYTVALTVSVQG